MPQMIERPEVDDSTEIMAALQVLQQFKVRNGIGAALSYVLHCAENHPDVLRRVMNEKVHREGFRGISLLEHLNRVCR